MEPESVFLSYVRFVFKKWTGLQQAIVEGMAGDYGDEKLIWLGNEVENYFKRYDKIEPDEVEDYLGAMIENEFRTYFEDNSLQEVSAMFCKAYPLSLTNPDAEMFQEMRIKPVIKAPVNVKSSYSSESANTKQSEQTVSEKMEQLTVSENKEDDGWTVVKRKNK